MGAAGGHPRHADRRGRPRAGRFQRGRRGAGGHGEPRAAPGDSGRARAAGSADPALQHHDGLRHAVRRRPHRPSDHRVCAPVAAVDGGRRAAADRAVADPGRRRRVAAGGRDVRVARLGAHRPPRRSHRRRWRAVTPPATSRARPPGTATTSWARWRARSTARSTSWAGASTTSRTTGAICARSSRAWSKAWSCSIRRAAW